jgi:hypothetical protein
VPIKPVPLADFPNARIVRAKPAKPKGGRKRRKAAQKARGRPSSAPLVLEKAKQELLTSDKARLELRGRKDFQAKLKKWLADTHPKERQMAAKTIGDHLSRNDEVRALLPKPWLRRR